MRSRIGLVAGALAAAALALPAGAAADFHGLCNGAANASVSLGHSGGEFTWRATMACAGADSIEVKHLELRRSDGTRAEAGPEGCAGCSPFTLTRSEPAGPPGFYSVFAGFDVRRGTSRAEPTRTARYHWDGSALTPVTSWQQLCDGEPSATVGFENTIAGTTPRIVWTGRVECLGADIGLIDRLSVRNAQTGQQQVSTTPHRCEPCSAALTGGSSGPTMGPGTHVVEMRFGVARGGVTFYPLTVSRNWLSLGAGPAVSP